MNIGIVGPQCAGKTTLASFIEGTMMKFAAPLYTVNYALKIDKNRAFMQEQSDLIKKYFGRDYFIKEFDKVINKMFQTNFICDDIRYKLELDHVKAKGWLLVYIDADEEIRRDRAKSNDLEFLPDHNSEIEIESLRPDCDIYINNTHLSIGTLAAIARELQNFKGMK